MEKIKIEEENINLYLPVTYIVEDNYHIIYSNDETKKFLDINIVIQEDSKEKAIEKYWSFVKMHIDYLQERSEELNKWKPLQIGPGGIGGYWFTFFGLNFYFRYGKNMKHGWYIPFTKLNILFSNYWKN